MTTTETLDPRLRMSGMTEKEEGGFFASLRRREAGMSGVVIQCRGVLQGGFREFLLREGGVYGVGVCVCGWIF